MLGFTTADAARSLVGRPAWPERPPTVLDEPRPVVLPDPEAPESVEPGKSGQSAPTQDQRRAVGVLALVANIAIDAVIVLAWLKLMVDATGRAPRFFSLVYVVSALLLLAPTYRKGRLVPRPSECLVSVVTRIALAPVLTAILTLAAKTPILAYLDMRAYALLVGATAGTVMVGRLVMFKVVQGSRHRGYDLEDTIVVGAGPVGVDVARGLADNPEFGLVPLGFLERFVDETPFPVLGRPEELVEVLHRTRARHVVLAFGSASEQELVRYVRRCSLLPVQFYAVPRFFELGAASNGLAYEVDGFSLVPLRRPGHGHSMWPAKRAFDLVVAGLLTLISLPVLVACAVAVKMSSRGPVFFKQIRVGLDGLPFEIYKFRSMRVNEDSNTTWTVEDDDRVTKVGHFLRQSHLDELPQLFNVLKGEMSIVGPRPERPYFVDQFCTEIDGYADRHRVPVGITGWAQVHGFWGDSSIEARVRLDNRYIENWSLWRDLVIALRTIPTFLGKRR